MRSPLNLLLVGEQQEVSFGNPISLFLSLPAPNHICAFPRGFLTLHRLDRFPARLQLIAQSRPTHSPPRPNRIPGKSLGIRKRVCSSASGPFLTVSRRIRSPNSGLVGSMVRPSTERPEYPRILASLRCKVRNGRTTPPLNELGLRIAR